MAELADAMVQLEQAIRNICRRRLRSSRTRSQDQIRQGIKHAPRQVSIQMKFKQALSLLCSAPTFGRSIRNSEPAAHAIGWHRLGRLAASHCIQPAAPHICTAVIEPTPAPREVRDGEFTQQFQMPFWVPILRPAGLCARRQQARPQCRMGPGHPCH